MRPTTCLVTILLATTICAQPSKPTKTKTKLDLQYERLQLEFEKAQQEYFAPYRLAKTDQEIQAIKLDPAKDPTKRFLPKFQKFARQSGNTDAASLAWMTIFQIAGTDGRAEAFDALVKGWPDSQLMEQLVTAVAYSYFELRDQRFERVMQNLDRIGFATSSRNVKAAVLYYQANTIKESSKFSSQGRFLYERVLSMYPETPVAGQARGALYEMDFLSVGKVAPDFEATDENGASFKLSDYRGKVVVLDFWGFW